MSNDVYHAIKYTRLSLNPEEGVFKPTETLDLGLMTIPHDWSKITLTHALIDLGMLSGAHFPDEVEFVRIDAHTLYVIQVSQNCPLGVLFKMP